MSKDLRETTTLKSLNDSYAKIAMLSTGEFCVSIAERIRGGMRSFFSSINNLQEKKYTTNPSITPTGVLDMTAIKTTKTVVTNVGGFGVQYSNPTVNISATVSNIMAGSKFSKPTFGISFSKKF